MSEQKQTGDDSPSVEAALPEKIRNPSVWSRWFWILLIPYSVVFALRFFASSWWLADLFSHFPLQGFCAGLFLIGLGLCLRLRRPVLVACLMTCWYGYELLPYVPSSATEVKDSPATKSLLAWNVYVGNEEKTKLIEAIESADADYVLLLEIDARWENALSALDEKYPVQVFKSDGAFGIAFLSREPVESLTIESLGETLGNSVVAKLPGGVQLFGVHFLPPRGATYSRIRNQQVDDLIRSVSETSGPVIVAGDLNLSRWSPHFSKLTDSGRLRDSRIGRGLINSWPAHIWFERTPIDHVLPSPEVVVHSLERSPDACGSDHFGLMFRFSVLE